MSAPGNVPVTTTVQTTTYSPQPAMAGAGLPAYEVQHVPASSVNFTSSPPQPVVQENVVSAPQPFFAPQPGAFAKPQQPASNRISSIVTCVLLLAFEILMAFMYGFFVRFTPNELATYFAQLQDINVMIFVGFAFLIAFLRNYAWSAIGHNLLIASVLVQLYILIGGFWQRVFSGLWTDTTINHTRLVTAFYSAASAIVSMSPFLGYASVNRLLVFAVIHNVIYGLNYGIIGTELNVVDIGGAIGIFFFGGVFGIAAALVAFFRKPNPRSFATYRVSYDAGLLSFFGALFLFVFWPSFNGGLCPDQACGMRAAVNTTVAMCSSTIMVFALTPILRGNLLALDMILNGILAGGVIMGACASLIGNLFLSILWGCLGGILATLGFAFITPALNRYGISDPLGIVNVYLLPGFFGGLFSSFIAARWFDRYFTTFVTRSNSAQGGMQLGCLAITFAIALAAGAVTGLIMRFWPSNTRPFDDEENFKPASMG